MAQKFFLLLRWIAHIQEHLILILQVPLLVFADVCDVERVDIAEEVKPILVQLRRIVGELRPLDQAALPFKNQISRALSLFVSIRKLAVLLGQFRFIVLSKLR